MRNDLAALVGSRICHDLISPIGAIGNGVELLSLGGGETGTEMALISESVENANARIRFFRIAYGGAGDEQTIRRSEILQVLSAAARGGRYTYFWEVPGDRTRTETRLAFLALQCLETALPMGGDITISRDEETWQITGHSDRIKMEDGLWDALTNPRKKVMHSPAQVQFALLPLALQEARRSLSVEASDDGIALTY